MSIMDDPTALVQLIDWVGSRWVFVHFLQGGVLEWKYIFLYILALYFSASFIIYFTLI